MATGNRSAQAGKALLVVLAILVLGVFALGGWWYVDSQTQARAAEKLDADSLDIEYAPVLGESGGKLLNGICDGCGQRVVLLEMMDANDPDLYDIAELSRLETLNLSLCSITDAGLPRVYGLKRLKHVDLAYNSDISAAGVAALLAQIDPVSLDLGGIDVTPELAAALAAEPRIESLVLSDSHMKTDGLGWLASLTGLRTLTLRSSKGWEDGAIAALAAAPRLEQLDLTNTPVSDASAPELAKLAGLKRLKAARTKLTEEGVAPLRAKGVEVVLAEPKPKRSNNQQLNRMMERFKQQQGMRMPGSK